MPDDQPVALVTGAAHGLGRAVELAGHGYRVLISAATGWLLPEPHRSSAIR